MLTLRFFFADEFFLRSLSPVDHVVPSASSTSPSGWRDEGAACLFDHGRDSSSLDTRDRAHHAPDVRAWQGAGANSFEMTRTFPDSRCEALSGAKYENARRTPSKRLGSSSTYGRPSETSECPPCLCHALDSWITAARSATGAAPSAGKAVPRFPNHMA